MLRSVPVRTLGRLLAVTIPLYFTWEMLQAPFFTGMPPGWVAATAICAMATLGDGVLVALVAMAGAVLDRWGYAPSQPVLPVVRVGSLPVLQPIVLLPLVFWLAAKWEGAW
jgi:hypothetical protein